MPVFDFLSWRFAVGAVLIVMRPRLGGLGVSGVRDGVLRGRELVAGYVSHTFGLQGTAAGISGFLTGPFVVFTAVQSWPWLLRGCRS